MKWAESRLKVVVAAVIALIVVGGFAIALLGTGSGGEPGMPQMVAAGPTYGPTFSTGVPAPSASAAAGLSSGLSGLQGFVNGANQVITTVTESSTTVAQPPQTTVIGAQRSPAASSTQQNLSNQTTSGRSIEFFSNVTMESSSPEALASKIIGLAFSVGGYVAYQSTQQSAAYVIVRVPASTYESTLAQVEEMGNVTALTSNSNDVTVQYTNLNATLVSLEAEQQALLRLINGTTKVNDTLAIEDRLQGVDAQINFVESEILQTQRLVAYSTITVWISKSAQIKPLTMTLSATPRSGVSPLGVTFNAVVGGGHAPYVVNYNFGDGSFQQGQIVIHQFYQAGDYNVSVSATDSKGNVTMSYVMIHVAAPPTALGFGNFPASLADLFVRVVEGMATVAVVVLPVAGVLAVVLIPLRKRGKGRQELKQQ